MQLHELRIALRPRTGWEALDLGFVIARTWWLQLTIPWLIWATPALAFACYIESHFWSIFVLWFFKPYYERAALRELAGSAFGNRTSVPSIIRSAFKNDWTGECLFFLKFCFLRLSLVRSMKLPLSELEQTDEELYRHRARTMFRTASGYMQTLTIVGFVAEAMFFLSIAVTLVFFVSPDVQSFLDNLSVVAGFDVQSPWHPYLIDGIYFLVLFAVAPFYVACGFSLYINRRTELESWDLELGFRNLVTRVSTLAMVCLIVANCTLSVMAQEPTDAVSETVSMYEPRSGDYFSETRREVFKARIERVVASDVLADRDYVRLPKFLKRLDIPEDNESSELETSGWGYLLATVLKITLIIVVVLAVVYVLSKLDLRPVSFARATKKAREEDFKVVASKQLFTGQRAIEAALSAWRSGDTRLALSIIYGAAVHRVQSRFDLQFEDSDTEEDCIEKASALDERLKNAFVQITRRWQRCAYAGRKVEDADFQRLLELFGVLSE